MKRLWKCRCGGKRGKPLSEVSYRFEDLWGGVFHSFHLRLEIAARLPTFPQPDDDSILIQKGTLLSGY